MATTTTTKSTTRKSTPAGRTSRSRSTRSPTKTAPASPAPATAKTDSAKASVQAPTAPGAATAKKDEAEVFRRPDLIQAVAERSSIKRSEAKMVLELVLEELGKALDTQDELALQPLGKLTVKRRKTAGKGEMLTVKLKRNPPAIAAAPKAADDATSK